MISDHSHFHDHSDDSTKTVALMEARGYATGSLVLGLVGVFLFLFAIPAVLAVVLGEHARKIHRRYPDEPHHLYGSKKAIAGIALGWGSLAIALIAVIMGLAGL